MSAPIATPSPSSRTYDRSRSRPMSIELRRHREPELHLRQERVPAGEQLRALVGLQGRDRGVDRVDPLVLELRRDHAAPPSFASLDRSPDALGRRRLLDRRDAEVRHRVDHRVHDGGRRRDRAGLADALHAERVRGRRRLLRVVRRHLGISIAARDQVLRHRRRREVARPRRRSPPRRGPRRSPGRRRRGPAPRRSSG